MEQEKIRNVAIIAHVDHGKTTLIDGLFKNSGVFAAHQQVDERVMDSGDQERERGITITAKNASFDWQGVKVNIVDTPGHADFGGEVERALYMADGALLLVDAAEGPLPQTRFVLKKALERHIKIICVINKVDRPDARVEFAEEKLLELFYDVAVDEAQTDYKTVYASAKEGWASLDQSRKPNFNELLDLIVAEIPSPKVDAALPFQMLVTDIKYSPYIGQIAVGRIAAGVVEKNQRVVKLGEDNQQQVFTVTSLQSTFGLSAREYDSLAAGNIALVAGVEDPKIGDTLAAVDTPVALPRIAIDPPTVTVRVAVNTSPLAGKEGNYATSRKLYELLLTACLGNVALELEKTDNPDIFILKARGELALVVLTEQLKQEGWEFMVGRPEIIPIEKEGKLFESEEELVVDVPAAMQGAVTSLLAEREGKLMSIEPLEGTGRLRMFFHLPARGLIGIRSEMLTLTRGQAVFSSSTCGLVPYQGKRLSRTRGALVADRSGTTSEYALFHLQPRGRLFVKPGIKVYEGMIFGEHSRENDLNCNPCVEKKLTNVRAAGRDESTKLKGFSTMELEEALEWIDEDEWVEITPKSVRPRKLELKANLRKVVRKTN